MALRLRSWKDAGVAVKLYVSTSGDFVSLGTVTDYPFQSGGPNGNPLGWTTFDTGGVDPNKVTRSVGIGRWNIAIASGILPTGGWYFGAYMDIPATSGHTYQIQVQAQTIDGRDNAFRTILYQFNGMGTSYGTALRTGQGWEQVGTFAVAPAGTTFIRVSMQASWYEANNTINPNWGIQFQSFRVVDQLATYPNPTWQEITCDVRAANIRYGRNKITERFDVGSMTVAVNNDDGDFTYRPNHRWGLRPGRFIRATLSRPGSATEFPLYYGIIDSFSDTYTLDSHAYVNIQCVDTSSLLSNTNVMTVASASSEFTSSARFRSLALSAGWLSQMLQYGGGEFIQQSIIANGRTIRDEMGLTADSEGAFFWADSRGNIVFRGRNWNTPDWTTVQAEILATPYCEPPLRKVDNVLTSTFAPIVEANALETNWGRDRVVNELQLANQGGSAFHFIDTESQQKYGPITYQRLDFVNSNNYPQQLIQRAADLMDGFTESVLRVNSVSFRPSVETFEWMSTLWLNELVRIRYELEAEGSSVWIPDSPPTDAYILGPVGRASGTTAANRVQIGAGDWRMTARVRNDFWNSSSEPRTLIGNWGTTETNGSWAWYHQSDVRFDSFRSAGSGRENSIVPDAATRAAFFGDNQDVWIGVRQRGFTRVGVASQDDGETWMDIGTPNPITSQVVAPLGSIIVGAASNTNFQLQPFHGRIYEAEMWRLNQRDFTFPGTPGNYMTVAYNAATMNPANWGNPNFDHNAKIQPDAFVGIQPIVGRWTATDQTHIMRLNGARLELCFRTAAGPQILQATVDLPYTPGQRFWVRANRNPINGQIFFSHRADQWSVPSTWSSLGAVVTGVIGPLTAQGAEAPRIATDGTNWFKGKIYRASYGPSGPLNQVWDVSTDDAGQVPPGDPFSGWIGGPVIVNQTAGVTIISEAPDEMQWRFDANEYPGTGTSFVDPRGQTWGSIPAGGIVPSDPGTPGHYENRVRNGWGFSIVTHVQAIEQSFTVDDWQVSLALDDPKAFNFWEASPSGTGWDEGLWDTAEWDA